MRWPWVSRELFDIVERHAEQYVRDYEILGQKYVALVHELVQMKREGFDQPKPDLPVCQPLSTDLADEEAAMDEASKPVEVGPFRDED